MTSLIPDQLRDIPARWRLQVAERRLLTTVDPAADALERAAKELEREIAAAEDEGRTLTTAEYARARLVAPGTVRKWCLRGELPGAALAENGEWRIPRQAVRKARTRRKAL